VQEPDAGVFHQETWVVKREKNNLNRKDAKGAKECFEFLS